MEILAVKHRWMRDINKSTILSIIHQKGPISKSEIAKLTSLNKTTVTTCVDELIDEQLVKEIGLGSKSQGRPPLLLGFNGMAGYVLGTSLETEKAINVVSDLEGRIIIEKDYRIRNDTKINFMQDVIEAIRDTIADVPPTPLGLLGIGVGTPGIVDTQEGVIIHSSKFPKIKNLPLKEYISRNYGVNVYVEENSSAAMAGNYHFGNVRRGSNMIYVHLGTGLGSGLMLEGKIFRGTGGFTPKLGHSLYAYHGKKCVCGNLGCLEMYASELALVEHYTNTDIEPGDIHLIRDKAGKIIELAMQGDNEAYRSAVQIGKNLGRGIGSMVNIFNPDHIVVGGRLSKLAGFLAGAKATIHETGLAHLLKGISIEASDFGDNAVAIGAASLVIQEIFDIPKAGIQDS